MELGKPFYSRFSAGAEPSASRPSLHTPTVGIDSRRSCSNCSAAPPVRYPSAQEGKFIGFHSKKVKMRVHNFKQHKLLRAHDNSAPHMCPFVVHAPFEREICPGKFLFVFPCFFFRGQFCYHFDFARPYDPLVPTQYLFFIRISQPLSHALLISVVKNVLQLATVVIQNVFQI